jgi:ABC-type nitrate/sulfonate/bicarbonate transport system substrate-binding protein
MKNISRRQAIKTMGTGALLMTLGAQWGCRRQDETTFRLQQPWVNDAEFLGYIVAKEKGYYKKHGLDGFDHLEGGPSTLPEPLINTRRAEIALTTPDNTVAYITRNKIPLKIIGAQYQTSPMGLLSLRKAKINVPQDLKGKKVAVPQVNILMFEAFLKVNGLKLSDVELVPYTYDPTIIVDDIADATLDFIPNVAYTIKNYISQKKNAQSDNSGDLDVMELWLADEERASKAGYKSLPMFMDTVVVREDYLSDNRDLIIKWFKASREGWRDVFKEPEIMVDKYLSKFFKDTRRSRELEIEFCKQQQQAVLPKKGTWQNIFEMSEENIEKTVESLKLAGIADANVKYFDSSLLNEIAKA